MSYYSDNARELIPRYNGIDSDELHSDWIKHLPDNPGHACDIGAGTGRDAYWLADKGWQVLAVEPEANFRNSAEPGINPAVIWLDDKLPDIHKVLALGQRFDLVLLSAVWMHLPESARERAFKNLIELLVPGGKLVISLRHSSSEEELKARTHYPVSVGELREYGDANGVSIVSVSERPDGQGREYVSWETVVLLNNKNS